MQPQVDDQFLTAMGLGGLPDDQKEEALATILKTLDLSVSQRVSDQLTEEQLGQLDQLLETGTEDQISQWLAQNVHNYQQIIEEEAQKMKDEALADVQAARPGDQQ